MTPCYTENKREDYVTELAKHVHVDVDGKCGTKKCFYAYRCNAMLKNDNKFYVASRTHCVAITLRRSSTIL